MQDASEEGLHSVHVAGRPSHPGGDGRRREQREAIRWLVWGYSGARAVATFRLAHWLHPLLAKLCTAPHLRSSYHVSTSPRRRCRGLDLVGESVRVRGCRRCVGPRSVSPPHLLEHLRAKTSMWFSASVRRVWCHYEAIRASNTL